MAKKTNPKTATKNADNVLNDLILFAIREKKGKEIVSLDLSKLKEAPADHFFICTADSTTQARAIAESVEDQIWKNAHQRPFCIEGRENSQWILLDYANSIVHIFLKEYRDFYNIEDLWNDGQKTQHQEA